jgi:hypothetical protein
MIKLHVSLLTIEYCIFIYDTICLFASSFAYHHDNYIYQFAVFQMVCLQLVQLMARQVVSHRHVRVNDKKVVSSYKTNIPISRSLLYVTGIMMTFTDLLDFAPEESVTVRVIV